MEPQEIKEIIIMLLAFGVFFSGFAIMYYKYDKRGKEIDAEKERQEREQRAH